MTDIDQLLATIDRLRVYGAEKERENERLRALNVEMREALSNVKMMDLGDRAFIGVKAAEFSFASAMIAAEDREIFLEWKAKHDAILAKTETDSC